MIGAEGLDIGDPVLRQDEHGLRIARAERTGLFDLLDQSRRAGAGGQQAVHRKAGVGARPRDRFGQWFRRETIERGRAGRAAG